MQVQHDRKTKVALLSVVSNTTLVAMKLVVGWTIGSVSVISEALHSAVDLVASAVALFAVRAAAKPADDDHSFGHGKFENVSGVFEAILIFLAGVWIIRESVEKLFHPQPLEAAGWGVAVMLVSAVLNAGVSHLLFRVGKETDSVALMADAWHLRTDVYTSAGVMAGLGLIWAGRWIVPGKDLHWLDPAAAIAVALLILKTAYDLTADSLGDLVDASLHPDEVASIRNRIAAMAPHVRGFHELRTRKSGAQRFIQFHLLVEATMSLAEAHRLTDLLEHAICQELPGSHVTIHAEPCPDTCNPECVTVCTLDHEARRTIQQG